MSPLVTLLFLTVFQDTSRSPGLGPVAVPSLGSFDVPLLVDTDEEGVIWARGDAWKASFASDGVTYLPYLGAEAPRHEPLRFRPAVASRGGVGLESDTAIGARRDGSTIELDRGPFSEVYHASREVLEQTFVFPELGGEGDLVVEVPLETRLVAEPFEGGFRFSTDLGEVRYGAAFAVDASGRRLGLEQSLVGNRISIVVPHSFIAEATLPLTIDPIVSTHAVTNDSRVQVDVDLVYDRNIDRYLVAYSEVFAANDIDVISLLFDPTSGVVSDVLSIDLSMQNWAELAVANCPSQSTFMCVASVGTAATGRDVRGRSRFSSNGTLSSPFTISSLSGDHHSPAIGALAQSIATQSAFAVVWERASASGDSDILGQSVSRTGTPQGGVVGIALGAASQDQNPTISASTGVQGGFPQYLIVWEAEAGPGDRDLQARVAEFDLDLTGHAPFNVYTLSDSTNPDVSVRARSLLTPDNYWVVVFERLVGAARQIFAVVVREGDPDNARSLSQMQNLALGLDHSDPSIAHDGSDFFIAYRVEAPGGADLYYTTLNVTPDSGELRSGLAERRFALRGLDGTGRRVVVSTDYETSTSSSSRGVALWVAAGASGPDTEVGAAVLTELSPSVLGAQYCVQAANSTGVSAWIRAAGNAGFPNSPIFLSCLDLPPNAFGYFIVGPDSAFVMNPGGSAGHICVGGNIGRYSNSVASSGPQGTLDLTVDHQVLPTPTGTVAAMSGQDWYFQCWSRDLQNGAATSTFSNAVEVYFQ